MKIASLWLDDVVTIALGKSNGPGEPRQNLQELSFNAPEWDITEIAPGRFSLLTNGMPRPVIVGGYGHSYVAADVLADIVPVATDGLGNKPGKGRR